MRNLLLPMVVPPRPCLPPVDTTLLNNNGYLMSTSGLSIAVAGGTCAAYTITATQGAGWGLATGTAIVDQDGTVTPPVI